MKSLLKNKNSKVPVILTTLILIFLGIASFFIYSSIKTQPNKAVDQPSINYSAPTSEQAQTGKDIKALNNATPQNQTESPSSGGKQDVTLTINYANQDSNRDLNLRVMINAIDESGSCLLEIKRDDKIIYTSSVETIPQSSYSTCSGFTVPHQQLESGPHTITVHYSSNTYQGNTAKELIIQ